MSSNNFSRTGFILAAIGSAVGLGNIWRFPYVAYDNGGGAFFLPYLIALLTTGLAILALEFAIGTKYRGSAPLTYARIGKGKKFEFIGWLSVLLTLGITTYYPIIIAWAILYMLYSLNLSWGSEAGDLFYTDVLHLGDAANIFNLGDFIPQVLAALAVVWLIVGIVLLAGVKKGIERASKIMIPLLLVLFIIFVIRAVTLEGASVGLNAFFTPSWDEIFKPSVWIAAYGQIFFSLSLCMGIMITYSSYLPRHAEIGSSALITGFANSSVELLAGFGVFGALGFMATMKGVSIADVATSGPGLIFAVFPEIISQMPFAQFFGVLFFLCIVLAGITSLISLMEVAVLAFSDKFKLKRRTATWCVMSFSLILSIPYATGSGLYILDIVDYFVKNIVLIFAAILTVLVNGYISKTFKDTQTHLNTYSNVSFGLWWSICIKVITPFILILTFVLNIGDNLAENYGGYADLFIYTLGWGTVAFYVIGSIILTNLPWHKSIKVKDYNFETDPEEAV